MGRHRLWIRPSAEWRVFRPVLPRLLVVSGAAEGSLQFLQSPAARGRKDDAENEDQIPQAQTRHPDAHTMFLDRLVKLIYIAGQRPRESSHRLRFYTSRRTRRVMKLPSKFTALVCCIVLIVLAGAGTTLRGQTAGFAYVANANSNNVSAYAINGTTGALTEIVGSPFPAGGGAF